MDVSGIEIFLLMGQSNMVGCGDFDGVEPIEDARILNFNNHRWETAKEPLDAYGSVCLAMSFAREMLIHSPGKKIGLVQCAVGATEIDRWIPSGDLYKDAVKLAQDAARSGEIKGVLWHQGESDAYNLELAGAYYEKFKKMTLTLRRDLNIEDLPFVVGELGRFLKDNRTFGFYPFINDALRKAAGGIPSVGFVSSEKLTDKGDLLHFDGHSLRTFGVRYAGRYLKMI